MSKRSGANMKVSQYRMVQGGLGARDLREGSSRGFGPIQRNAGGMPADACATIVVL